MMRVICATAGHNNGPRQRTRNAKRNVTTSLPYRRKGACDAVRRLQVPP